MTHLPGGIPFIGDRDVWPLGTVVRLLGVVTSIMAMAVPPLGHAAEWEIFATESLQEWAEVDVRFAQGMALMKGIGVERDIRRAVALLQEAAEDGLVPAMYYLGNRLLVPSWPIQDNEAGVRWLMRAAEAGFPQAMAYLAVCFHKGESVERNAERSRYWESRATESGDQETLMKMAEWRYHGAALPPDRARGIAQLFSLAQEGFLPAKSALGRILLEGGGGEERVLEGLSWIQEAAEEGEPDAQIDIVLPPSSTGNENGGFTW